MARLHMRDFVDDRTKDRWQSLPRLYTSGTPGKLQTCPSWTTDGIYVCGWERAWRQTRNYVGTSAGVRRCRSIWRRPEKQRWDRKMLTDMNGEPWNPTGHHQDKPPQVRGVYITLERQIKYGGTKGCAACFGDAKIHSPECRARFQNIVDNEAAQTAAVNASEPNAEMREQAAGGSASSSSSGPTPAAGRPAPEDANMEPDTADEFCGSDVGS